MNEIKRKKLEKDIIRTLSLLIVGGKVKDPRVSMVSMHRAEIADDLSEVKIFITAYTDNNGRRKLIKGLNSAAPFMTSVLGKNLRMRRTPRLKFIWDNNYVKAMEVNELIDRLAPKTQVEDES